MCPLNWQVNIEHLLCAQDCLIQSLAIDWMQEMQVRKDKMKRPMAGIGVFEKGGDLRVQLDKFEFRFEFKGSERGQCRWKAIGRWKSRTRPWLVWRKRLEKHKQQSDG